MVFIVFGLFFCRSEFGFAVTGLCFIMVLVLPPTKSTPASYYDHSNDLWLKRAGFVPRKAEDFRDGGAFPEIHIEQYPLDMGRDRLLKPGSKIVPVIIDSHGNIAYDVIVRQNENSNKILYSQHKDLEPKVMKYDCEEKCDDEELKKEIEKTTLETKAALENIVNVRLSAAQPKMCQNSLLTQTLSSINHHSNQLRSTQGLKRG